MLRVLVIGLLIICNPVYSQLNTTYHSLTAAKKDPVTVEYLILQKKKLSKMPDSLFIFENLLGLDLSKNKIDLLSEDIGLISRLEELDLSRNNISVLPPQISKLENLRKLVLSKNSIKQIPPDFGKLYSLEELVLDGNKITKIPSSIYQLRNLKLIDLRQMEIEEKSLTDLISNMPNTRVLHSTDCACGF